MDAGIPERVGEGRDAPVVFHPPPLALQPSHARDAARLQAFSKELRSRTTRWPVRPILLLFQEACTYGRRSQKRPRLARSASCVSCVRAAFDAYRPGRDPWRRSSRPVHFPTATRLPA